MVVHKRESPACGLKIGDNTIKQVQKFNYLGSLLTENGKCDEEIKKRIWMTKDAFQKLQKIVENSKLSLDIRKWILDCYVKPILTYGSKSWTKSSQIEKRIKAAEIWFYWRMLKISWTHLMSNEEVLRRAETKWILLVIIWKRQLEVLGHIMRKNGLEELILAGSVDGKEKQGKTEREREKYLTNISRWVAEQLPRREKDKV